MQEASIFACVSPSTQPSKAQFTRVPSPPPDFPKTGSPVPLSLLRNALWNICLTVSEVSTMCSSLTGMLSNHDDGLSRPSVTDVSRPLPASGESRESCPR
jgi:hypothetical protein